MELHLPRIIEAVAMAHPEREALLFRDRRLLWSDLADRMRRLAVVLAEAGLGGADRAPGTPNWASTQDHVALYLHNGNEYLEGMLGAYAARCAPFNVNYRYVAEELAYLLEDADAAAVVYHARFAPLLAEVLPGLRRTPALLLCVDDGSGTEPVAGSLDYESALAAANPRDADALIAAGSPDDLYLCYTGGTTGMPKGVMWRQADFLVAALGVRTRSGGDYEDLADLVAEARGTVRALPAPPLMHGAAHWNALSAWVAGGTVIIQDQPEHLDPADIWRTVDRYAATSLLIVGDPFARPLLDELHTGSHDTSSLRHVLSGGAVLSPATKAELLDALPGVTVVDVLGSSESGRQAVSRARTATDGAGRFRPEGTTVVLSEDLTRHLAPGEAETGWLAQGGRVPLGYLGDAAKTARTFPEVDGVRHAVPGDRALLHADGGVELLGRDSVCINTGGEKVFAEEVETAIKAHPAVLDAVVCGRPSERWGQEVVALVQLRDGMEPEDDELRATCAEHLARYKLPKAIIRLPRLVRSPSGKADYRWAREQAEGRVGR